MCLIFRYVVPSTRVYDGKRNEEETLVPSVLVCNSMIAEHSAMLVAFTCLPSQPEDTRSRIHSPACSSESIDDLSHRWTSSRLVCLRERPRDVPKMNNLARAAQTDAMEDRAIPRDILNPQENIRCGSA